MDDPSQSHKCTEDCIHELEENYSELEPERNRLNIRIQELEDQAKQHQHEYDALLQRVSDNDDEIQWLADLVREYSEWGLSLDSSGNYDGGNCCYVCYADTRDGYAHKPHCLRRAFSLKYGE